MESCITLQGGVGSVQLVDVLGTDYTPINAARVSYGKSFIENGTLNGNDEDFIKELVRNKHMSPFRHAVLQYKITAPLMVARQIWRYTVGSANQDTLSSWNEKSYRYKEPVFTDFYIPSDEMWRGKNDTAIDAKYGAELTRTLVNLIDDCLWHYEGAIDNGVSKEQARLFLPSNGLETTWYLTLSLQALCHLLEERLAPCTMKETRDVAGAMATLAKEVFPVAISAIIGYGCE